MLIVILLILLLLVLPFSFSFVCYDSSLVEKSFLIVLNKRNIAIDLKYLSDKFAFLKKYNVGFIIDNDTLVLLNYTTNADNILIFCSFYPISFISNLSCCLNKNVCVREKDLKYMVGFRKIPYVLISFGKVYCKKKEGLKYEDIISFRPYYYNKTDQYELIIKPANKLSSNLTIKIYHKENLTFILSSVEKLLNSLNINLTLNINYFKEFYYYKCEFFPTNENGTKKILKILSLFTNLNINDLKNIVIVAKSCPYPHFIFYFHGKWVCSKEYYKKYPFKGCFISIKRIFFEGEKEVIKKNIENKIKKSEENKRKFKLDLILALLVIFLLMLFRFFPKFHLS